MADYTATAVAEGENWVIDVHGVGTTHADTVGEIDEMAVALVVATTHSPPEDVHVHVRIV